MSSDSKNNKTITPPNRLKDKTGEGGIPINLLEEAQFHIGNNDIDFKPMASQHLKEIEKNFQKLKQSNDDKERKNIYNIIVRNIMLIKAHGGMFHYEIMSQIADIALIFLEEAKTINDDLFQIIDAHNNSIRLIIKRDIKGDGGIQGSALMEELQKATARYQKKYS